MKQYVHRIWLFGMTSKAESKSSVQYNPLRLWKKEGWWFCFLNKTTAFFMFCVNTYLLYDCGMQSFPSQLSSQSIWMTQILHKRNKSPFFQLKGNILKLPTYFLFNSIQFLGLLYKKCCPIRQRNDVSVFKNSNVFSNRTNVFWQTAHNIQFINNETNAIGT